MSKNKYMMLFVFVLLTGLIFTAFRPATTTATVSAEDPTATAPAAAEPATTTEATATAPVPSASVAGVFWTKDLREAIAASIDREALVDRVFEGRNTPAYGMVPDSYPYATEPFMDKYGTRDLDLAKTLLTKAGYSEAIPLPSTCGILLNTTEPQLLMLCRF
jgi:peptide/nickel transport system substrate-binding protein